MRFAKGDRVVVKNSEFYEEFLNDHYGHVVRLVKPGLLEVQIEGRTDREPIDAEVQQLNPFWLTDYELEHVD